MWVSITLFSTYLLSLQAACDISGARDTCVPDIVAVVYLQTSWSNTIVLMTWVVSHYGARQEILFCTWAVPGRRIIVSFAEIVERRTALFTWRCTIVQHTGYACSVWKSWKSWKLLINNKLAKRRWPWYQKGVWIRWEHPFVFIWSHWSHRGNTRASFGGEGGGHHFCFPAQLACFFTPSRK